MFIHCSLGQTQCLKSNPTIPTLRGSHLPNTISQNIPRTKGTIVVIIAVIICGGLLVAPGGEGEVEMGKAQGEGEGVLPNGE